MDTNIRLSFTGDLLCYKLQNQISRRKDGYDYSAIFSHLDLKQNEAYLVGSLETSLTKSNKDLTNADTNFNTPYQFATAIKNAGFDLLTTANNHALDRGVGGLRNTLDILDELGIKHVGTYRNQAESDEIFVKDCHGLKVAFLSFTYGTNSKSNRQLLSQEDTVLVDLLRKQERPNMLLRSVLGRIKRSVWRRLRGQTECCPVVDSTAPMEISNVENFPYIKRFLDKIKIAKEKSDLVVLCVHSGGQFNFYQGVGVYTKYVVELAKQAGVDCIIGNHTHCIMPLIWENGCVIAYSLGNFCFTPGDGYYVRNVYADYSMLLNIDISVESKTIQKVSFSILKTIRNADDSTEVWDTYDLFHRSSDKEEKISLYNDCKAICAQMVPLKGTTFEICKEYIVRLA